MSKKPQDESIRVVNVETLDFQSLERYVQDNGFPLNQQGLDESGWALVLNSAELGVHPFQ